jgi:predicted ATPase
MNRKLVGDEGSARNFVMAKLLGIHIEKYRSLADVKLGRSEYGKEGDDLPQVACFIGPNGSGKSTILDAFGFIADCLTEGVEAACDKPARGGIDRLRTQGRTGPIQFELFFEDTDPQRPIVYTLHIDAPKGVPIVVKERLRQRRAGETRGKPYDFLNLTHGKGKVWAGDSVNGGTDQKSSQAVKLAEQTRLGIDTMGNLAEHDRIVRLRNYIAQWYLSYFVPEAARQLPAAGAQRHLDRTGSNIGNVLQYFERQYSKNEFILIKEKLSKAIPGLKKISTELSSDKRLLIKFNEDGYQDPFYQQNMSDGTLKMLAYALLLADPQPRPFIGIEEPENGLYVELVEALAQQLIEQGQRTQLLVTTHSTYFVDALQPEQVWMVRKNEAGETQVVRTADVEHIRSLIDEGIPLGSLWYSRHLDGAKHR